MISDNVMVLNYRIGVWGAEKTDRTISNEVCDERQADHDAGKFIKNLLGGKCDSLTAIKNNAQLARMNIRRITLPYSTSSVLIPNLILIEVLGKVREMEDEFNGLVNDFIDEYPDIIERARERANNLFDENQCPTPEQVRSKFYFEYHLEPMPDNNSFDRVLGLDTIKDQMKQDLDHRMRQVFKAGENELKVRLLARLKTTLSSLESTTRQMDKRVAATNLEVVRSVTTLNVMGNADVTAICGILEDLSIQWQSIKENVLERANRINQVNSTIRLYYGATPPPVSVQEDLISEHAN